MTRQEWLTYRLSRYNSTGSGMLDSVDEWQALAEDLLSVYQLAQRQVDLFKEHAAYDDVAFESFPGYGHGI